MKNQLSGDELNKYIELTADLVQKYEKYPCKIDFMKKANDKIKNKIINNSLTISSLFASGCHADLASFLIDHGADVNKRTKVCIG